MSSATHVEVEAGVKLRCVEHGERSSSNVVLLLHGFPDCEATWRFQVPALTSAGYFVVTPDMRGYGESSKPDGVSSFSGRKLTSDVDALRRHYCGEDGVFSLLAGHDWGAAVVWTALEAAAARGNARIAERAAILNVPHPLTFASNLFTLRQAPKSWYIFAFQVPGLAEWLLAASGGALVKRVVSKELATTDAGSDSTTALVDACGKAAATPDAMRCAVSYYRASASGVWGSFLPASIPPFVVAATRRLHGVDEPPPPTRAEAAATGPTGPAVIDVPVLVLWGRNDPYLGVELATPPLESVPMLKGPVFYDCGHFVHWGNPDEVNAELLQFLAE